MRLCVSIYACDLRSFSIFRNDLPTMYVWYVFGWYRDLKNINKILRFADINWMREASSFCCSYFYFDQSDYCILYTHIYVYMYMYEWMGDECVEVI